jgi:3-hydroxyisobutyrate dehydrogenase-like beta-hydroxyacid dehydrogenase
LPVLEDIDLRVTYIGLGAIGEGMATNIARSGIDLTVFDLNSDAMQRVAASGARAAASVADAVSAADLVGLVVRNDAQVIDIMTSDRGVLRSAKPGAAVVIHSSVHPSTIRAVAEEAARFGVDVLDAGLAGGAQGAWEARLTLAVGGDEQVLARAMPVFDAFATKVVHFGPAGMGMTAKLGWCVIGDCITAATVSGMQLAEAAGIDLRVFEDYILAAYAGTPMMEMPLARATTTDTSAADRPAPPGGSNVPKDLTNAIDLAASFGIALPVVEATLQGLRTFMPTQAHTSTSHYGAAGTS